jgi:glutamate-1-semialdehyde 2,1-aminomutase
MEACRSWETITDTGRTIAARWRALAGRHGLDLAVTGLPALTAMSFAGPSALALKTLLTQEMLKRGYLAGPAVYVCTEHTAEVLDGYFDALDPVFALLAECQAGRDPRGLLDGPVCHAGFARLT